MQKPVRLGFIGCGKHALQAHAKTALQLSEWFSINSVFDPESSAVAKFAKLSPSLQKEKSAEDLLNNPGVDAVIIATPHQFHLDLLEKSVEAGKHVLCEKPLWVGDYTDRARIILQRASDKKLVVTSCHPRRFEPDYLRLRDSLAEYLKAYGKPVEFNFRFFYHKPPSGWKQEDSLLLDHMNHEIDIVNFILGPASTYLKRVFDEYDRYQVIGRRSDGVSLCFSGYRCLENRIYTNELEIIFERGRVRVTSALENGLVEADIVQENFENGLVGVVSSEPHPYDFVFHDVMVSFSSAIRGGNNYLTLNDLIVNTASCNDLLATGEYKN